MDSARIAQKLRVQILQFSGELSAGLPKVVSRLIREMIYGIQARQSVRLTEVSRALDEPIRIKKTVSRLSRQLGNPRLGAWLVKGLLALAAERIKENTLLVLDLSDIQKKYAKKMEHLAVVWDGSEKEKGWGYWTLNIIGAETNSAQILPLYGRLFSHRAPDFESENIELRTAIREVSEATRKRGIWVVDRGGDRGYLYRYLLHENLRFIVRARSDRMVLTDRKETILEAATSCPILFHESVTKEVLGREKLLHLEIGVRRVYLPEHSEKLHLVVVKGFGSEPMMLLTNLPLRKTRKSIWHVVSAYMTRWRIEETIRFMKQSYQLEDVRLLSYERLRNLMSLLTAVIYFTAVYLGIKLKLRVLSKHLVRAARRVFGVPDFRLYAIADGVKHILFNRSTRFGLRARPPEPVPRQHLLFQT
jgi:hypothetical protein